jgi:hypothetical protein
MSDLHEQFSRGHHSAVEHTSNRRFGLVVGGIFFLIGAVRAYLTGHISGFDATLALLGLALVAAALVAPDLLRPLNRAWAALGLLLHKVINPVALAVMFVVAIIPTGLMLRAFGKDPMARRLDRNADYWCKRTTPRSTADSLKHPF